MGVLTASTPWDRWLFTQVLALWSALSATCLVVQLATEELGTDWAQRLGRFSWFSSVMVSLALVIVLGVRAQQLRALGALGVGPFRRALGGVLAGWGIAAVAAVAWTSGWLDASSLLPAVDAGPRWTASENGFLALGSGISLTGGGQLSLISEGLPGPARPGLDAWSGHSWLGASCVALGVTLPAWTATRRASLRSVMLAMLALLLQIAAFQGVAAGRLSAPYLLMGSGVLAADLLWNLRSARAQPSP